MLGKKSRRRGGRDAYSEGEKSARRHSAAVNRSLISRRGGVSDCHHVRRCTGWRVEPESYPQVFC
jgi:hypothetical protein